MPLLLVALFIGIPLLELFVIGQVADLIGLPAAIVILVLDSVVGAWLVRQEGIRAWRRFTDSVTQARMPTTEIVDGALILFGGALLLTPGFVTDVVGLACVLTPTRVLLNRLVRSRATAGMASGSFGRVLTFGGGAGRPRRGRPADDRGRPRRPSRPGAIDVEVVDVQRTPRRPEEGDRAPGRD